MSFIIDPILLIGFGILIAYLNRRYNANISLYFLAIIIIFYLVAGTWYFDLVDSTMIMPGYTGGSDFMLNSWIFGHEFQRNPSTDFLAILVFLTYPLWLYLGVNMGLWRLK